MDRISALPALLSLEFCSGCYYAMTDEHLARLRSLTLQKLVLSDPITDAGMRSLATQLPALAHLRLRSKALDRV